MAAVQLSLQFNGDYAAAGRALRQQFPDNKQGPKHWAAYCEKYHQKFLTQGNLNDAPRTGRPPTITEDEAKEAVRLMATDKYWSVLHAAEHEDYIEALLMRGVSPSHLLRRMRQVDPHLCKHHQIRWCHQLSPELMRERLQAAEKYSKWHGNAINNIIFLDAATIYLCPKTAKVWGLRGQKNHDFLQREDVWALKGCLRYYVAVCPKVGPIALVYITGTMFYHTNYLVRLLPHFNPQLPSSCLPAATPLPMCLPTHALTNSLGQRLHLLASWCKHSHRCVAMLD